MARIRVTHAAPIHLSHNCRAACQLGGPLTDDPKVVTCQRCWETDSYRDARGPIGVWIPVWPPLDPRLPAPEKRGERRRNVPAAPWRSPRLIELLCPNDLRRARVTTNRTRTRWWYVVTRGDFLLDHASTTSRKIAQGWIDALHVLATPRA